MTGKSTHVFALLVLSLFPTLTFAQGKKGAAAGAAAATPAAAPAAATPSSGASSAAIESQVLATQQLNLVAGQIGKEICPFISTSRGNKLIIFDQASLANIQAYAAFVANVKVLASQYVMISSDNKVTAEVEQLLNDKADANTSASAKLQTEKQQLQTDASNLEEKINKEGAQKVLTAEQGEQLDSDRRDQEDKYLQIASTTKKIHMLNQEATALKATAASISGSIDPFSDATALLSAIAIASNTETPNAITFPDSALAVSIAGQLRTAGTCTNNVNVAIIYPPLFGPGSPSDASVANLNAYVAALETSRFVAQKYVKAAMTDASGKPVTENTVDQATLTDLNGLYDNLINGLTQANSTTGAMGSTAILQGMALADALSPPAGQTTYVLLATVVSASGTMEDHKSFITALGKGDHITYSGGLIVSAALWQKDAVNPLYAKVIPMRSEFTDMEPPKKK